MRKYLQGIRSGQKYKKKITRVLSWKLGQRAFQEGKSGQTVSMIAEKVVR